MVKTQKVFVTGQTPQKNPLWRESLCKVADNPDFIFINMDAIKKELRYDNPDVGYMKEKVKNIEKWIDEIWKFHYQEGKSIAKVRSVI
jgi:hypothetical protein